MCLLKTLQLVTQTSSVPTASVIFLHGSGDTGRGIFNWIKFLIGDVSSPHIRFLFPTAPLQPYRPLGGELSNVWFDRFDISPDVPEHGESIDHICQAVQGLINKEIELGIPLNRIVVGGFSMGGALALHMAYNFLPDLGGVFALSSFLNHNSRVYKSEKLPDVPLYMCHGDADTLVPLKWGLETFKTLKQKGVNGDFIPLKNALHELKKEEIVGLMNWVTNILPPMKS